MKISSNVGTIEAAVNIARLCVGKKSSIPILGHFLVWGIEGEPPAITSTDMDMYLHVRIPTAQVSGNGVDSFTIGAKQMEQILKGAKDTDEITLQCEEETKGTTQIKAGRFDYKVPNLVTEEFPTPPTIELKDLQVRFTIGAQDFVQGLQRVAAAQSTDETRPVLVSTLVRVYESGSIVFVATDTHRIHKQVGKVDTLFMPGLAGLKPVGEREEFYVDFMLPAGGGSTAILPKLLAKRDLKIAITVGSGVATFQIAETTFATRLIEGRFPNYERVIPSKHNLRGVFDRNEFIEVVTGMSKMAATNANRVTFTITGDQATLYTSSSEFGEVIAAVKISRGDGPTGFQTAFNALYMLDTLKSISGDSFTIDFDDPLRPMVIRMNNDDSFLSVVITMQVM